jgi:hypothetical protein
MPTLIAAHPNKQFAVGPSQRADGGEQDEYSAKEVFAHDTSEAAPQTSEM